MKLNRVHMLNFRQHADTEIEFGPGITGIIGPNGAGKTTILEAIGWALYGKAGARGKKEGIRFHRAAERAVVRVELDFDLSGHRYRVVRELSRAEVFLDGDASPIATSTNGVTELLQRRLGMSKTEFFNTYFTGQKQLSVMASMGASERAQFLSRVLGYEKLRVAQDKVREQRNLVARELAGLRAGMPDPEVITRALADAERRVAVARRVAEEQQRDRAAAAAELQRMAPAWDEMQVRRDSWHKTLTELGLAEARVASLAADGERIGAELSDIVIAGIELDDLRQRTAELGALTAELQVLDEQYREEGKRAALREVLGEADADLTRLRERQERLAEAPGREEAAVVALERKRLELEDTHGRLEERRTAWVRARQEAQTKLTALLQQHSDLKIQLDHVRELGAEGVCPTCSRVLGETFDTVIEKIAAQVEAVTVDGKYFRGRVEQLEDMPEDVKTLDESRRVITDEVGVLERELGQIRSAVQELAAVKGELALKEQRRAQLAAEIEALPAGFDAERHAKVRAKLDDLAPLAKRAERLADRVDREPLVKKEYERVATSLVSERAKVQELRARRAEISFSEEQFAERRAEYERASDQDRRAEVAHVEAESDLRAAREALASARQASEDLRRKEERAASLVRDRRLHDELDRGFSDLRTDLNAQLRPELSELASAFLSELTDGRYTELELTETYDILVLEEGIPKPVISGGEEDIASLVLRLAISQMIAERAGQAFSLLILDEVFGSLDEARRHSLVDLLRSIHDRFEQVVLITHIDSVRDGLDRVLTVRYDEASGASKVEECLPVGAPEEEVVPERVAAMAS